MSTTWRLYSQTYDEPSHLAGGMEWWAKGTYTLEPKHPPLGRATGALPLYLRGYGYQAAKTDRFLDWWDEGNRLIYSGKDFRGNLAAARGAMQVFFWLGGLAVFLGGLLMGGWGAGAAAVLFYSLLPTVLANGSLVTTDMPIAATLPLAVWMLVRWWDKPALRNSAALGVVLALTFTSKLTSIAYLPAVTLGVGAAWLVAQRHHLRWPAMAELRRLTGLAVLVALVFFMSVWAVYRFSFLKLENAKGSEAILAKADPQTWKGRALRTLMATPWPAGSALWGVGASLLHNKDGMKTYFRGEVSDKGSRWFFPTMIAIKTPVAFLLLWGIGLALGLRAAWKGQWIAASLPFASAAALGIMLLASVNLGVRHVLPVLTLASVCAGAACLALWNGERLRWASRALAAGLLLWCAADGVAAHPDYLPWFNSLAGGRPEFYSIDSDLDWGQDHTRLSEALRRVGAQKVWLKTWGMVAVDYSWHEFPPVEELEPGKPVTGWVAVSLHYLTVHPEDYAWLSTYPYEQVGKTIRLYQIPQR